MELRIMKAALLALSVVLAAMVVSPAFAKAAPKIDTLLSGCPMLPRPVTISSQLLTRRAGP